MDSSIENLLKRTITIARFGQAVELLEKYQQEYSETRPEKLAKRRAARESKKAIVRGEE